MKNRLSAFFAIAAMLCGATILLAQSGGQFEITKSVIAGGGARLSGGVFTLDGTAGQNIAGQSSSGGVFRVDGGFWTSGVATPVVSEVTVSGRVFSPEGIGQKNVTVTLIDSAGVKRKVITNAFGLYTISSVRTGETYTISASSRRYRFVPRNITVSSSDLTNVDFTGLE